MCVRQGIIDELIELSFALRREKRLDLWLSPTMDLWLSPIYYQLPETV